jgi:hypothetical protein
MIIALLWAACFALTAAEPRFASNRVLPANSSRQIALEPGMIMSIYGEDLGPAEPCVGYADQHQRETPNPLLPDPLFANTLVYPKVLCGVQVRVGVQPAGLLYVSNKQINFKVPQETGIEGTAELRVIYQGQSSAPATLAVGLEKTHVFLDRPGYVGMPVWLRVELPLNRTGSIRYPYILGPAGFGCNVVEVRLSGVALKQIPQANWFKGGIIGGNMCGSYAVDTQPGLADLLPLHLLYRFEKPGIYEVRLNRSAWTPIEILPQRPGQRSYLLAEAAKNPPTDSGTILCDFLPNILGFSDDASFEILAPYLYHPFQGVRRYAQLALSYWPEDVVPGRLLKLLRSEGPSDEIVYRLAYQQTFLKTHSSEIIRASLKYIDSDSKVLREGAIRGIGAALLKDADPAVAQEVIEAAGRAEGAKAASFIDALGSTRDPSAHELLWKWQELGIGEDRPYYSIAQFRDPQDLPKIGAALVEPGHGAGQRGQITYLPYYLHSNFGAAALPYLETALANSPNPYVRISCAEELTTAGRRAGFAFIADAIQENRKYSQEMIQFLRDRFPELKNADRARLLAFLAAKSLKK